MPIPANPTPETGPRGVPPGAAYSSDSIPWDETPSADPDMQQSQSQTSLPPASIVLANADNQVTLSIGPDGDLWVTQQTGPNAGKQVDLTYGKWL